MADEQKVPAGAMYIGLNTARAQAANLRWQYAIVFMALNGVMGNACFQYFDRTGALALFPVILIAGLALYVNTLWRGLTDRANQWIEYYTTALESLEKVGTESGVLVFAHKDYLSRPETEHLVRGHRFRRGIKTLNDIMLLVWFGALIALVLGAAVLYGQGKVWGVPLRVAHNTSSFFLLNV